jgi:hypothetical protein
MCHLAQVALDKAPLIPKLRGQFAEFLHHHSLKRLSILYLSTSVGLGYGLYGGAISWKKQHCLFNPIRLDNIESSSSPTRFRNINLIPISYDFRPCLRGRLTLRGLPLRRKPWTFGGSVFHTSLRYSCQHSHFRYLQKTLRFSFNGLRNAPLPRISKEMHPRFRCMVLAPLHFRRRSTYLD